MAFREVTVVQINDALRRWLRGEGERTIATAGAVPDMVRQHETAARARG